jgi:hypothetical protein
MLIYRYCYCGKTAIFLKLRYMGRFEFRTKAWKQEVGEIPLSIEGGDNFDNSSAKNEKKT